MKNIVYLFFLFLVGNTAFSAKSYMKQLQLQRGEIEEEKSNSEEKTETKDENSSTGGIKVLTVPPKAFETKKSVKNQGKDIKNEHNSEESVNVYVSPFYRHSRNVIKSKNDPRFQIFTNRVISEDYNEGTYLIYNCVDSYYVCADEGNFKSCQDKVDKENRENKEFYSCLPVKGFADEKKCNNFHMDLINYYDPLVPVDLCLNYSKVVEED